MALNVNDLPDDDPDAPPLPDFTKPLPKQGGGAQALLDPGTYRFKLPKLASAAGYYDLMDNVASDRGPRLSVNFQDDAALHCLTNGQRVRFYLSDIELERGKRGSGEFVSDMSYFFSAVKIAPGGGSRKAKAEALIAACESQAEFSMDTNLRARCNPKAAIWKEVPGAGGNGSTEIKEQAGTKGCGAQYGSDPYKSANSERLPIAKDPQGRWPFRVTCKCGASLWVRNEWTNFQAA